MLGRRGREAIAPFPADRHPGWGWGGEGRQAAQRKEEVNKRVLKEVLPIHCIKKNLLAAFWISIFYHLIAKLGCTMILRGRADQAAATE